MTEQDKKEIAWLIQAIQTNALMAERTRGDGECFLFEASVVAAEIKLFEKFGIPSLQIQRHGIEFAKEYKHRMELAAGHA